MPGMAGTMREFKEGRLHSGSKEGPIVKSRAQAIAIGLNEMRDVAGGRRKRYRKKLREKM